MRDVEGVRQEEPEKALQRDTVMQNEEICGCPHPLNYLHLYSLVREGNLCMEPRWKHGKQRVIGYMLLQFWILLPCN